MPADIPALREQLRNRPVPGVELDILDRRALSAIQLGARVLGADGKVDAILLNGSGRLDQLIAAALWRRRSRTAVVISDCTWELGSSLPDRMANRIGIRAIDSPRVRYCVLSRAEVDSFPRAWDVDRRRVAFTPFCYTLTNIDLAQPATSDGSVFAGGDSMRDYATLVRAAPRIRGRIVLATRRLKEHVPVNVAAGPVSHARFVELMRRAAVVVVPLMAGTERSGGQQTYLNAMALRKIVVATDSPGIRDYIEDGKTGIVVPAGDDDALAAGVNWALDPTNAHGIERMQLGAREAASKHFNPLEHFNALLAVVRRAAQDAID